jgi:hypothetical protein
MNIEVERRTSQKATSETEAEIWKGAKTRTLCLTKTDI